jgi:hypothetical protein
MTSVQSTVVVGIPATILKRDKGKILVAMGLRRVQSYHPLSIR